MKLTRSDTPKVLGWSSVLGVAPGPALNAAAVFAPEHLAVCVNPDCARYREAKPVTFKHENGFLHAPYAMYCETCRWIAYCAPKKDVEQQLAHEKETSDR